MDKRPLTEEEIQLAKNARAEYAREYRKKNPEKAKEIRMRYWLKKARENGADVTVRN